MRAIGHGDEDSLAVAPGSPVALLHPTLVPHDNGYSVDCGGGGEDAVGDQEEQATAPTDERAKAVEQWGGRQYPGVPNDERAGGAAQGEGQRALHLPVIAHGHAEQMGQMHPRRSRSRWEEAVVRVEEQHGLRPGDHREDCMHQGGGSGTERPGDEVQTAKRESAAEEGIDRSETGGKGVRCRCEIGRPTKRHGHGKCGECRDACVWDRCALHHRGRLRSPPCLLPTVKLRSGIAHAF